MSQIKQHGGKRIAGPGKALGRPRKERKRITITLDNDLAQLVKWHANAREITVSESINILLGEALRNHTIDAEAQEVH